MTKIVKNMAPLDREQYVREFVGFKVRMVTMPGFSKGPNGENLTRTLVGTVEHVLRVAYDQTPILVFLGDDSRRAAFKLTNIRYLDVVEQEATP